MLSRSILYFILFHRGSFSINIILLHHSPSKKYFFMPVKCQTLKRPSGRKYLLLLFIQYVEYKLHYRRVSKIVFCCTLFLIGKQSNYYTSIVIHYFLYEININCTENVIKPFFKLHQLLVVKKTKEKRTVIIRKILISINVTYFQNLDYLLAIKAR